MRRARFMPSPRWRPVLAALAIYALLFQQVLGVALASTVLFGGTGQGPICRGDSASVADRGQNSPHPAAGCPCQGLCPHHGLNGALPGATFAAGGIERRFAAVMFNPSHVGEVPARLRSTGLARAPPRMVVST